MLTVHDQAYIKLKSQRHGPQAAPTVMLGPRLPFLLRNSVLPQLPPSVACP